MKNRSFRRWLTLVLVLAMLLGILPAVAAADASLSDYAPAGTTNLAVGATLTVSNGTHNAMGQENSYEMPSEHWSKDFVHDGVLDGQGFSTNPYDSEPDASVQVVLTFDLGRRCSVSKFGVFARAGAIFPTDYQIETSLDGEMWSVAAEQTGAPKDPAEPYFYELDSAVEARYVRLNVTKRYAQDSIGGARSEQAANEQPVIPSYPSTVKPTTPSASDSTKLPFSDVRESDWFYEDVAYVYEKGMMNGTGRAAFGPDASTTRGMIVTILARMEGVDTTKGAAWYAAGREWAMKNGISDGTNMEANITREQLATILFRYVVYKGLDLVTLEDNLSRFSDRNEISSYAVSAMNWAVGQGLVKGSGGKLNPKGNATRAQVAAILHRFCELGK